MSSIAYIRQNSILQRASRANEPINPFIEHILTLIEWARCSLSFSPSHGGAPPPMNRYGTGDRRVIGMITTDRSYQFLRVITRVGHTEGPQRIVSGHNVSGLNADIAM